MERARGKGLREPRRSLAPVGIGQQRIEFSYYFGVSGSKRLVVVRRQQGNGLVEPVLFDVELRHVSSDIVGVKDFALLFAGIGSRLKLGADGLEPAAIV